MQRKEYLILCQEASVYYQKHNQKQNIPPELLVIYDGRKYCPAGYQMRFENMQAKNTAILRDLNSKSELYCELSKVTKQGECLEKLSEKA